MKQTKECFFGRWESDFNDQITTPLLTHPHCTVFNFTLILINSQRQTTNKNALRLIEMGRSGLLSWDMKFGIRKILFNTHQVLGPAVRPGLTTRFSMALGSSYNTVNYSLLNLHPFLSNILFFSNAEDQYPLHFLDYTIVSSPYQKWRVSKVRWSPSAPLTSEISNLQ